jgi:hypothetical protein
MNWYNIFNSIGLILIVVSAACIAIIGLKNSVWYRPSKGIFSDILSELSTKDIKLAKISGLAFLCAIIIFIIASIFLR